MKIDGNHRIATINDIKYAWSISKGIDEYTDKPINKFKYVRIWEKNSKKFIFEQKIPSYKLIGSIILSELINARDRVERDIIIAEPCPFCRGKVKEHPNPEWREDFYVCYHDEDCFLCEGSKPMNFTLINPKHIVDWNYRKLK